jgi:pilus assembly protein Flp/PilA
VSVSTTLYRTIRLLSQTPLGTILRMHHIKSRMIKGVNAMLRSFFAKEDGQGLVEYALILVLIAIVVIGILTLLGGKVSSVFSTINSGLS